MTPSRWTGCSGRCWWRWSPRPCRWRSRSCSALTTTTSTRCASRSASRAARGRDVMTDSARHRLPRDRRPRPAGPAARHPRRPRARDGALAGVRHRTVSPWETDLSSQTGASQAGLLLGSNDDIPAFRWVEKETGRIMTCSAPPDCALIEGRHSEGPRTARRTAARAAAICFRATPTRSSSPSAAWRPRRRPTPAIAPTSPTATTSRGRSCSSSTSWSWSGRRGEGSAVETCSRAGTDRSSTRSCAPGCPSSCATSRCTASSAT